MKTAGVLLNRALDVYCRAPSSTRATSRNRTTASLVVPARMTMSPNCCGSLSRPTALIWNSNAVSGGAGACPSLPAATYILLCDRILDIHRGDAEGGELVRIEPYAHRVAPLAEDAHVADTRKPLQRVDQLQIGVVAEGHEIDRSVRRSQVDPQQDIGVLLGNNDAGLVDNRRQLRCRLR